MLTSVSPCCKTLLSHHAYRIRQHLLSLFLWAPACFFLRLIAISCLEHWMGTLESWVLFLALPPAWHSWAPLGNCQLGVIDGLGCRHCAMCQASSQLSFSFVQDAVLNACYRGCRLFSICHFVDASAELNTARTECESACTEAYSNAEEQFGCVTGCRKQLPETQSRTAKVSPASFSMFDLVSSFCNDMVSSAQSFISSTWTFYLQADDGKVVVFQVGSAHAVSGPVWLWEWGTDLHALGVILPGPQEKLEKPARKELKRKTKVQHLETQQPEHDFLGCMSKRSGLPRWILAACLFLSIMVMLWLSCASLVTAPDQHVKTQVRSRPESWGKLRCRLHYVGTLPWTPLRPPGEHLGGLGAFRNLSQTTHLQ
uniref:Transmembrane protein 59 like n=1 Tax=Pelusios castaneus TaxID=367368 RepID=A0A8C8RV50_9SAUR